MNLKFIYYKNKAKIYCNTDKIWRRVMIYYTLFFLKYT